MSTKKDWVELAMERCEAATPGPWRISAADFTRALAVVRAADELDHALSTCECEDCGGNFPASACAVAHAQHAYRLARSGV